MKDVVPALWLYKLYKGLSSKFEIVEKVGTQVHGSIELYLPYLAASLPPLLKVIHIVTSRTQHGKMKRKKNEEKTVSERNALKSWVDDESLPILIYLENKAVLFFL